MCILGQVPAPVPAPLDDAEIHRGGIGACPLQPQPGCSTTLTKPGGKKHQKECGLKQAGSFFVLKAELHWRWQHRG